MAIFGSLNMNNKSVVKLHLKIESELTTIERNLYIADNRAFTYSIYTHELMSKTYCPKCDTLRMTELNPKNGYCDVCNKEIKSARSRLAYLKGAKKREETRLRKQKERSDLLKLPPGEKVGYDNYYMEKSNDEKLERAEKELYLYEYFQEHGHYPLKKNTDNNIIYLWVNEDSQYKIGITSKRRGTKRIHDVARNGGMRAEILLYIEVENAISIESKLLKFGTKVRFTYTFDGCTEFRNLSEDELDEIVHIIHESAVL